MPPPWIRTQVQAYTNDRVNNLCANQTRKIRSNLTHPFYDFNNLKSPCVAIVGNR